MTQKKLAKTKKMEVFLPKYKDSAINNEVNNFGKTKNMSSSYLIWRSTKYK